MSGGDYASSPVAAVCQSSPDAKHVNCPECSSSLPLLTSRHVYLLCPFSTLGLSSPLLKPFTAWASTRPHPSSWAPLRRHCRAATCWAARTPARAKRWPLRCPCCKACPARRGSMAQALVLVPTRELATQVGDTIRALAQHLPQQPRVSVVFGGVSINPQMMGLRGGTEVLVATPGRLLDLVAHNAVKLSGVQSAGARRGRPPAGPGFCRRTEPVAGAAARQAPKPVFLGHFRAGGAGAGQHPAA